MSEIESNMGILTTLKDMIAPAKVDYASLVDAGAVIIDVRSKEEFRQGHAKGSVNIPMHALKNKVKDLIDKEVILVCRSGARAGQAKSFLKDHSITAHNAGPWQTVENLKK